LLATPKAVSHCHSSQCRKGHGVAFASYGSVPREVLRLLRGAEIVSVYASTEAVRREFCSRWGASLFWSRSQGKFADWVSIALATLDTWFKPQQQKHVHIDSVAPWYELAVSQQEES